MASTTTNDAGQWRYPVLAPGSYVVDVELTGFAAYHEEELRIGAGATLSRTVVLKPAGIGVSIVVEGSGSRIEARGSGFETRLRSRVPHRPFPTRRFSMFDAIRSAPGVSPTSPSSGTVNTVAAFGSGGNENLFLIDGTNFTCPCAGVARAEPSVDVIQEVQVQSVGVSAEYGNIQGTVFNVVTKQGGNRFQSDASYYGQASGLTSQPVLLPVPGRQSPSGYERERYRDFATNLGGPVVRDRLWFFGGYQYLRDYDSQPGTEPAFPRKYEQDKIFAKLTWKATPSLQLMQSFHDEFWVNPQVPSLVTPFAATQRQHALGADHDIRAGDARSVRQHALGGARRTIRVFTRRRPELGRSGDAEQIRSADGCLERKRPELRRADSHPDDGEGDTHALPAAGCSRSITS